MNTNNEKSGNSNRNNNTGKHDQNMHNSKPNQLPNNKNISNKKGIYIKDMPPIDGARPGVI